MFGLMGQLAELNIDELKGQALDFANKVLSTVERIEASQKRIEEKLDKIIEAGQSEG